MDKYDMLEDKMCAILSIISDKPRKMCDKYVTELNQGIISTDKFMGDISHEYGEKSVQSVEQIMKIIGDSIEW